jgi:hypothetical protein
MSGRQLTHRATSPVQSNAELQDKNLKVEFRRWRGPVVQAVAENLLRKQGTDRSRTGFDDRGLDHTEIGEGCHPPGGISIKVLPFGFDRPSVNRFYDMRLITGGRPKTGSDTERQRANGNDYQQTPPPPLTNATLPQRSHISVNRRPLRGIMQHVTQEHRHYLGHWTPREVGYRIRGVGCLPATDRSGFRAIGKGDAQVFKKYSQVKIADEARSFGESQPPCERNAC